MASSLYGFCLYHYVSLLYTVNVLYIGSSLKDGLRPVNNEMSRHALKYVRVCSKHLYVLLTCVICVF